MTAEPPGGGTLVALTLSISSPTALLLPTAGLVWTQAERVCSITQDKEKDDNSDI